MNPKNRMNELLSDEERKRAGQIFKDNLHLRRASVTLSPYITNLGFDMSYLNDDLNGTITWNGTKYNLRIKNDSLLTALTSELLRLEPAMIGGKVSLQDVEALIISLYANVSVIGKDNHLRMRIKKSAGLFKDKSLRNKAISTKIMSNKNRSVGKVVRA